MVECGQAVDAEATGMARIATGIMVILFWTGLANGPAGAAQGQEDQLRLTAIVAQAEAQAVDRWLMDVAACEAGDVSRCAPVLY